MRTGQAGVHLIVGCGDPGFSGGEETSLSFPVRPTEPCGKCEHDHERGEAGVQVPLLPHRCAGSGAVAHLRVRTPGLQPCSVRTHGGVVHPAAAGRPRGVLGRAHRLEEDRGSGVSQRGVLGPLQQGLRHLQTAFRDFFDQRTRSGSEYRDGQITSAKMSEALDIVWSRPLPQGPRPSSVTVSKDSAGRRHVSIPYQDTIDRIPAFRRGEEVDCVSCDIRAVGVEP